VGRGHRWITACWVTPKIFCKTTLIGGKSCAGRIDNHIITSNAASHQVRKRGLESSIATMHDIQFQGQDEFEMLL
jgi:hypothetical protein